MIQECEDHGALSLLLAMLTVTDNPNTDHALNAIFAQPVRQRLNQLGSYDPRAD
jgi:hypothetical protein